MVRFLAYLCARDSWKAEQTTGALLGCLWSRIAAALTAYAAAIATYSPRDLGGNAKMHAV